MKKKRLLPILRNVMLIAAVIVLLVATGQIAPTKAPPVDSAPPATAVLPSIQTNDVPPIQPSNSQVALASASADVKSEAEEDADARDILVKMALSEKIYQMFLVTPELLTGAGNVTQAGEATRLALLDYPVGGIVYFEYNLKTRDQVTSMIAKTQSYSEIPLFIAVDEEGGTVTRVGGNPALGTTSHPPMAEIGKTGDVCEAYRIGAVIGADISKLGFNVDFAPVADITTNPNNTEIGSRSFGSDPKVAADMVAQVVRGLQYGGVSATLKHFPGHGSTQTNSHHGYSESTRTLEEMKNAEFIPFSAGIDAGADFVMMSHMSAVTITGAAIPCSLSKIMVTDLLRNQLGFEGIVITDSLQMGAITAFYSSGEAAVMAIQAGVDMLLCPVSITKAYDAVYQAVQNGEIPESRIDDSVLRILQTKINRGIIEPEPAS